MSNDEKIERYEKTLNRILELYGRKTASGELAYQALNPEPEPFVPQQLPVAMTAIAVTPTTVPTIFSGSGGVAWQSAMQKS